MPYYVYYLVFIAIISIITFVMYAVDKSRAKRNAWRIKESMLLLFGFLGGAIGGLLGMRLCRHKTKHWYFWAVNILGLVIQLGVGIYLIVEL